MSNMSIAAPRFAGTQHQVVVNGKVAENAKIKVLKPEVTPFEADVTMRKNPDGYDSLIVGQRGDAHRYVVLFPENGDNSEFYETSNQVTIDGKHMETLQADNEGPSPMNGVVGTLAGIATGVGIGAPLAYNVANKFLPHSVAEGIGAAALIGGAIIGGMTGQKVGELMTPVRPQNDAVTDHLTTDHHKTALSNTAGI